MFRAYYFHQCEHYPQLFTTGARQQGMEESVPYLVIGFYVQSLSARQLKEDLRLPVETENNVRFAVLAMPLFIFCHYQWLLLS